LGSLFDLGTVPVRLDLNHYRRLLEAARGDAFELMVHPVRNAGALAGLTRIADIGEREWRFLMSESLSTLIAETGFTRATYRDI
jgi:predicted glycoside hydrolase/deacetylase ChbG (UPF0249 family)